MRKQKVTKGKVFYTFDHLNLNQWSFDQLHLNYEKSLFSPSWLENNFCILIHLSNWLCYLRWRELIFRFFLEEKLSWNKCISITHTYKNFTVSLNGSADCTTVHTHFIQFLLSEITTINYKEMWFVWHQKEWLGQNKII